MTPIEKLTKARAGLVMDQVFWASLALRLPFKADETVPRGATNGLVIKYNPGWIDGLSLAHAKTFIAHESGGHVGLAHHVRRGDRDPKRWNIACDYVVNILLKEAGFDLPSDCLFDSRYTGMSTEEVYEQLPQDAGGGEGGDSAGGGKGQDDGDGWNIGGVEDFPGKSESDFSAEEARSKVALVQAAQQAKAMGSIPGGIQRLLDEVLNPKVNWREALRYFVTKTAKNDYSWVPPNHRYVHKGLYLPSLRSLEMGDIVVAVDTSGSISARELEQFAGEMTGILEEFDTVCHVIYCDTEIDEDATEVFTNQDLPLTLTPTGGGGTSFIPPFEWVEENGIDLACFVYLTDLCSNRFPDETPDYPVLWGHIGSMGQTPPFGEVLEID
jgi:predicted metal-dependent peptidase